MIAEGQSRYIDRQRQTKGPMRHCSLITCRRWRNRRFSQIATGLSNCDVGRHRKPPMREVGHGALVAQKPDLGYSWTDLTARSTSPFSPSEADFWSWTYQVWHQSCSSRIDVLSFGTWPAGVICWIKNILFLVSAGVGK